MDEGIFTEIVVAAAFVSQDVDVGNIVWVDIFIDEFFFDVGGHLL